MCLRAVVFSTICVLPIPAHPMTTGTITILTVLFFVIALLFSSVGHAGATGYLAAMGLMGVELSIMRPTALVLNVFVAALGTWQFARAGCFRWALFWPFALTSIPAAFLGGQITLPGNIYKPLVGLALLVSAARLALTARRADQEATHTPTLPLRLALGAVLGFLAGLTGIGGGVFLSPVMLWFRWGRTREVSAVAAAFILVNSLSGLAGNWYTTEQVPQARLLWIVAAIAGGSLGSYLGSRRLASPTIRRLLAAVLILSGIKLVASAW